MSQGTQGENPTLSLRYLVRHPTTVLLKSPCVLLFHGYGSNEADLFSLARSMPPEFLVLSVRGPLTLGEGQYAWYALDWSSGAPVGDPKEAEAARLIISKFIDEVTNSFPVDTSRIVLLGFSQGTIMSFSVALTSPSLVRGVIALSGRILEEVKPRIVASPDLAALKIFLAHGIQDSVIPVRYARDAKQYLGTLGITPEYHEYEMGHGVIREEEAALAHWLTLIG